MCVRLGRMAMGKYEMGVRDLTLRWVMVARKVGVDL